MLKAQAAFSGISVDNLEAAKQFYTEVLGLELLDQSMGLRLKLPNNTGILFVYLKPDHEPASFTVLNFVVDDIDAAVAGLKELGVGFKRYESEGLSDQQDELGIMRGRSVGLGPDIAWFEDPAGNILAVLQDK